MKKFVKNVLIFIGVALACIALLVLFDRFVIGKQYTYNYQASIIDKIERLESINEPKIILVGHSNLAFGIQSDLIEEEIGMPVVNLGLHGGLGNAFHEQIAKLNINSGDIVIVCHSSFADSDEITDAALAWITYDWNGQVWSVFREKDYKTMILSYPVHYKNVLLTWLKGEGNIIQNDSCYSRTSFNEYGDVVVKPASEQLSVDELFKDASIGVPEINETCINRLNELNAYCEEKGATLVVAAYPIGYGIYSEFTEKDFEEFQKELAERLDCEIISNYTDYFYPYEYFYNTTLHLTNEGAKVRTLQLIDDIKNWSEKNK